MKQIGSVITGSQKANPKQIGEQRGVIGYPFRCWRPALFGIQGGRYQSGASQRATIVRDQCPLQRDLPRADRNGYDQADIRLCP